MEDSGDGQKYSDVYREAKSEHKFTFIYIHGLHGTGADVMNIAESYIPDSCKIICPTAPRIPLTSDNGAIITAWCDQMCQEDSTLEELQARWDNQSLEKSADRIIGIIEEESKTIPTQNIFVGGFS